MQLPLLNHLNFFISMFTMDRWCRRLVLLLAVSWMVLVTSSHPAVVPVVSTTDQALAPSGEAGVATSPSPTGLGAGDKCASFVVHAAFNILGTYTCMPLFQRKGERVKRSRTRTPSPFQFTVSRRWYSISSN